METREVTLLITERCNLECVYCYEHGKAARDMPLETAIRIIEKELNADDDAEHVAFQLFGGEPFIAFGTIEDIVRYLKAHDFKKSWSISSITNGTLIHGRIQDWLKDNPDFALSLSLDGTKQMHDANRCGSFDNVDLDFFAGQYPGSRAKMTVSPQTLGSLAEGVVFLHSLGFRVHNNLGYGIDWSDEANVALLERELMSLVEYYRAHPEMEECSLLAFPFRDLYASQGKAVRSCDAGCGVVAYDVDGREWPCHMFMPMTTGGDCSKHVAEIEFPPKIVPCQSLDEKCRTCGIVSVCGFCYADNWLGRGSIYACDDAQCELSKITFRAKAFLAAEKWARGLLDLTEQDEKMLIAAIRLVNEL